MTTLNYTYVTIDSFCLDNVFFVELNTKKNNDINVNINVNKFKKFAIMYKHGPQRCTTWI